MDEVRCYWDAEVEHCIVYAFPAMWTWKDFYKTQAIGDAWLSDTLEDTAMVLDFSESAVFPPNSLVEFRRVIAHLPPNARPLVVVGENQTLRAMMHMAERIYPRATREVLTFAAMDAARAFLAKR